MNLQASTAEKVDRRKFVYVNANFQKIFRRLVDRIVYDTGSILLVGQAGIGKTAMLHRVIDILGATIRPLYFDTNYLNFNDLTVDMCKALDLDVQPGQELLALESFFDGNRTSVQPVVFFIDSAEKYDEQTFNQLLSLVEVIDHKKNAPSVIFAGRPDLLNKLSNSRESRFRKNLVNDYCEMHPLANLDIEDYLDRRLQHYGLRAKVSYSDAALAKLIHYSKGVPGTINRLCDEAISTFPDAKICEISGSLIEEIGSLEPGFSTDKPAEVAVPQEQSPPQENEEENLEELRPEEENPEELGFTTEAAFDIEIKNDHESDVASYIQQNYSIEESTQESSTQVPFLDEEKSISESLSTPKTGQTTGETETVVDLDSKKLADVLASVYTSKRFSSSVATVSESVIQPNIAEKKGFDGEIDHTLDTQPDDTGEQNDDDTQLFEQQSARRVTDQAPNTIDPWDEESGEPFAGKDDAVAVKPVQKKGYKEGAGWLLATITLFVVVGLLSYYVVRGPMDQPASMADVEPSDPVMETETLVDKQSSDNLVAAESSEPSVTLPVVGESDLPGSAEDRTHSSAQLDLEKGGGTVGDAALDNSLGKGDELDFPTEIESLGMAALEKYKGDDGFQGSILVNASKKGYVKAVDQLLEYGYDVNYHGEYGDTALIWAVVNGHFDTVQVLLEHGADFSIANKSGVTAMSSAIHTENIPIIETLVNAGANPHSTDEKNRTTLMVAVAHEIGNKEFVERLLLLGVNVDAVAQNGRTALMNAVEKGNEEVVRILLRNHADVAMTDKNGDTASQIAKKAGFDSLAKLLDSDKGWLDYPPPDEEW